MLNDTDVNLNFKSSFGQSDQFYVVERLFMIKRAYSYMISKGKKSQLKLHKTKSYLP